jgi:hypothetical protein
MRKNVAYRELSYKEKQEMANSFEKELNGLSINHPIISLLGQAWFSYKHDGWRYDGPTFSRAPRGFWEVAAFIHDYRNSHGYVSKPVDREMFSIMIVLNYPLSSIIQRYWLTRLTWVNIIRHWLKGTLKKSNPQNLYYEITI